ncbi:hypothetical protein LGR54_05005 [Ancylobacter sp. Lp-2]|uniref:hypothetical protein n=1 Tax=Ancylobacter sp. Lp-2 TaxID=2881339 RepID=UPI001E5BA741|nr:hypothetical protein [Ancylobacter sp. Lp-2]MCB4767956.1 hypothetical protein [Ancylobacter sp. Lp-2]
MTCLRFSALMRRAHHVRHIALAATLGLPLALATGGVALAQGATAPSAVSPAGTSSAPPSPADGAGYVFGSPPSVQANRLYSVNTHTGEVSACQFERPEGSVVGVTRCFPRDASAGPGEPGTYDMVSTRYSGETGVFRVNVKTGAMSVCYVRDMPKEGGGVEASVVCTAPAH